MIIDLSDEANEYGRQALRAFQAAGGDLLVQRTEAEPSSRAALVEPVLAELGAWELEPRDDADSLEAAAALCRSAGYWALPYPVAERLARPADLDADGLVVVASDPPSATLDGIEGRWVAACDSLGAAEAMLSATVDYVKVRHQFGRPIGSFQAVKHACADMLVQTSVARQLVNAAVAKVAEGADASVAAAMAKSYACGAAVDVVGKAMQLHGGIGYTWESGVHVFLKRAVLNRSLFGSPAAHRRRLAARYV